VKRNSLPIRKTLPKGKDHFEQKKSPAKCPF